MNLNSTALLRVKDLSVRYGTGWRARTAKPAVSGVSFEIAPGQTLGIVGESGSGKSTTGKAVLRLVQAASGNISFDGTEVTALGKKTPLSYRRDVQSIFQDPGASLNPRQPVSQGLHAVLARHRVGSRAERKQQVADAFEKVGLAPVHLHRYPGELSGGQNQRVAIARALVLQPRLVVCDEAVSALDLSTQSQIINLLAELQESTGVSYLFIAHDLGIVRHISHRVAVMNAGQLVEQATTEQLFEQPEHPYTRALLAARPAADPYHREERRLQRANAFASSALA
ncbi:MULTISPECIES: ATP-binding cassette domain-containing protein [unclassified Glutamicibacter]|uniref:ATP-binding cassette domain-containing protein n=1 Tax=unclassified Glutamicibacter TaxID=2627139 RepID=UPI0038033D15